VAAFWSIGIRHRRADGRADFRRFADPAIADAVLPVDAIGRVGGYCHSHVELLRLASQQARNAPLAVYPRAPGNTIDDRFRYRQRLEHLSRRAFRP
jgi:hypothetical protein